ncbi:MAG: hypothetical protein ASARMPRED_006229 [Alectoria sarmentosa]|nr:MAG: hypothetical protein ASARMPRED_006229 [Alectoria sarmentosa]
MATKPGNNNLNVPMLATTVLRKPLALFSQKPMTGFYRDGYCRVGPEDGGNHAVAGVLTKEFLDFSASRGNNLRSIGLEPGCKWCLCTARWKEAMEAAKGQDDPVVPKLVLFLILYVGINSLEHTLRPSLYFRVFLHATDESALQNGITMDVLKKFAAEPELEKKVPIQPGTTGGIARETH